MTAAVDSPRWGPFSYNGIGTPQPRRSTVRAVTATAVVRPDHTLTVQVPEDIAPGSHQVVVVLDEEAPGPQQQAEFWMKWKAHDVGLAEPSMTFRREDIYDDDGR
jgi:hypothetical protein